MPDDRKTSEDHKGMGENMPEIITEHPTEKKSVLQSDTLPEKARPTCPKEHEELHTAISSSENPEPEPSAREKLRRKYAEFSEKFQKENADRCPLIAYPVHWFYPSSPTNQRHSEGQNNPPHQEIIQD